MRLTEGKISLKTQLVPRHAKSRYRVYRPLISQSDISAKGQDAGAQPLTDLSVKRSYAASPQLYLCAAESGKLCKRKVIAE